MADTGAPWNLPYPLDTDLVKDGAEAIEDLALAVDAGLDATKVATNLTSGTLPSARISGSYTGLTGTGALNAGSITSGFGNVNIGSSTFTGNGSGLTQLAATSLTGTIASARISGSYTGITGTGALNAGSITSGFGNINIGSSTFTGNGSGLTNLDATDLTGTIAAARLPAGTILQVVSTTKTNTFTTASTGSFVDVTGLSVSITPTSASSTILVFGSIAMQNGTDTANHTVTARIVRDSTALATVGVVDPTDGGRGADSYSISYEDSPSTTSATTYKWQVRADNTNGYVNRGIIETSGYSSSITVMEVA